MIKILEYSSVPASEVFSRVVPEVDVSGIVSDIIANAKSKIRAINACKIRSDSKHLYQLLKRPTVV